MLTSMAIQPKIKNPFRTSNFLSQNLLLKPLKTPFFSLKPNFSYFHSHSIQITRRVQLSASQTEPILYDSEEGTSTYKEKLGVVVKPMEKPRIVLKFIWMQKVIGIALDQVIPGHGTIPLSPYHFWPHQDAWEQLKLFLESKPWISRKQMIILLNQATDMIDLWQTSNNTL